MELDLDRNYVKLQRQAFALMSPRPDHVDQHVHRGSSIVSIDSRPRMSLVNMIRPDSTKHQRAAFKMNRSENFVLTTFWNEEGVIRYF